MVIPIGKVIKYDQPYFAGHEPNDFKSIKHFCDFLKGKAQKSKQEDKKKKKKDEDEDEEDLEDIEENDEGQEDENESMQEESDEDENNDEDDQEVEPVDENKKSNHVNWAISDKKAKEPVFRPNVVHFLPKWMNNANLNYWLHDPEYVVYKENQV